MTCMLVTQPCPTLRLHELRPARLLSPWNSPGKNTDVGCHSLLQDIFLTQGLNPGLLHCRQILYHLSFQGSRGCSVYLVTIPTENLRNKPLNKRTAIFICICILTFFVLLISLYSVWIISTDLSFLFFFSVYFY